jgi:hypothetical protein
MSIIKSLTSTDIKNIRRAQKELQELNVPTGIIKSEIQTKKGMKVLISSEGDILSSTGSLLGNVDDLNEKGWLNRMVFGEDLTEENLMLSEKIVKRGDKWLVMDSEGKKTLGTHDTKKAAEKQLTAIHISQSKGK